MSVPTIQISHPTLVTFYTAMLNGRIVETLPEKCDAVGFVYDTVSHANPTDMYFFCETAYAYNIYTDGEYPAGEYPMAIADLTMATKYYVRFGAFGPDGGAYSDEFIFYTLSDAPGLGWGQLLKNQVDPEKIEDAIERIIEQHNDDPESHLEVGQSLQSHKAYEIIDHLAKSIIEDKIDDGAISTRCITADQIVGKDFRTALNVGTAADGVMFDSSGIKMWQGGEQKVGIPVTGDAFFKGDVTVKNLTVTNNMTYNAWSSLDTYEFTGNIVEVSPGNCYLATANAVNQTATIKAKITGYAEIYEDYNPILEIRALFGGYSQAAANYDFHIGIGDYDKEDSGGYFCFEQTSGTLRARYLEKGGGSTHYVTITGISTNVFHTYRIEVTYGVNIKYYIDGVLKATITHVTGNYMFGRQFFCNVTSRTVAAFKLALLKSYTFSCNESN